MKSKVTGALLAVGIALAIPATTASPAAAATTGGETVLGRIVTSGVSGTRTTIASVAVAKGVFNGVGRIVAVPRPPTDPPIMRVDLVYPVGTMHLVSTSTLVSFTLNPDSCLLLRDDPGRLAHHRRHRPVRPREWQLHRQRQSQGLLPRNPDGSCAGPPALHEVDMVEFSGTLSF